MADTVTIARPLPLGAATARTAHDADSFGGYYSPALDGLRACAALMVFVHHAPALPLLGPVKAYGWVGVDLFLGISAFLITRLILLEKARTGAFELRSFFIRRALRIWPLYFLYVTGACLLAFATTDLARADVLAWWLSHLSFTNNVMTAVEGYSPIPYTAHLWTISLEEQAYILMPLLLSAFFVSGGGRRTALQFCLAAVAVLVVARSALVVAGTPHPFIWVLPLRADAFLLGALAAILTRDGAPNNRGLLLAAGLPLMASVALFQTVDRIGPYQVVGYTVVALGCTALVLATQGPGWFASLLGCAPARYLGKISYGIYVYHLAGIAEALASRYAVETSGLVAVVALGVTVALAALSYRLVERPFLVLKNRYARVATRPV